MRTKRIVAGLAPALLAAGAAGQPELMTRYEALSAERRQRDETVWARETAAQRYESFFVRLWDDIRASDDAVEVIGAMPFEMLTVGPPTLVGLAGDGRLTERTAGTKRAFDPAQLAEYLRRLKAEGYRLEQCEFHHAAFHLDEGRRAASTVNVVLHVANDALARRWQVTGKLEVEWSDRELPSSSAAGGGRPGSDGFEPRTIDFAEPRLLEWDGPAVFRERFTVSLEHGTPMDDLLVYDLNGDGLSDFAYPTSNEVFFNEGDFTFRRAALCDEAPVVIMESVFADFTGDGETDFLCAGVTPTRFTPDTKMRLFLYAGDGSGHFAGVPRRLGGEDLVFERPDCFAVGDIDGDGDLDVWLTQYMAPYLNGQFPKPYYDANDGLPSFLLVNDGTGDLADATESAGLAPKRFRRTFRASFADLDTDGDLDLVVVSDFAGVDVYENDGRGGFTDVTAAVLDDPSCFGMSHTFGDFDADGALDIYVTGMGSTTARRLEAMGLGRADLPDYQDMRMRIAYGNRMYLRSGGGYRQPDFRDDVARSGWAWGCATLDVDSDGRPEIYVSNGNRSGRSARDYCTTFWCHDIYSGTSQPDQALGLVFAQSLKKVSSGRISWNGFEHNHLFLNLGTEGFANVAYLFGVALEEDSRAAIADDFDLDGQPDLLVVTFDRRSRYPKRVVRIFENAWPQPGNWIGVRLAGRPGVSPIGAGIVIATPSGRQAAAVVTGDSAKSQHSSLRHFGIGRDERVEYVEVRWPGGAVQRVENPAINTYHDVVAP